MFQRRAGSAAFLLIFGSWPVKIQGSIFISSTNAAYRRLATPVRGVFGQRKVKVAPADGTEAMGTGGANIHTKDQLRRSPARALVAAVPPLMFRVFEHNDRKNDRL